MREESDLYSKAAEKAWKEVEAQLRDIARAAPGRKLEVVEVGYDPLPGVSIIDELPEGPKSSKPQAVEASIRLRVSYVLH